MKKSISVKKPTEIELEFEDGNTLNIIFNAEAISNFNKLEDGLKSFITEDSFSERCAKIIYIGALDRHPDLTIEKARILVSQMDFNSLIEISNDFTESMGSKGELSEMQKKLMQQFLNKIMK